jgi:hypothetical protein
MAQPNTDQADAINRFVDAWRSGDLHKDHDTVRALARTGINDLRSSPKGVQPDGANDYSMPYWDASCDRISFYANGIFLAEVTR